MITQEHKSIIKAIAEDIDIPEFAYENAQKRYEDLGKWIGRDNSSCAFHDPHIFPQGSFRLGTVIRPPGGEDEYDLDLACELREDLLKSTVSQKELKNLVGGEVMGYRNFRGIENKVEEKHRCWRLVYKDQMKFHMDIVPCIPEEQQKRKGIKEAMLKQGTSESLAKSVSELTVAITDDRHPNYSAISYDWNISNPEGYARWFESRMKLARQIIEQRVLAEKAAQIDELPIYKWKMPLQQCVQILKRHRDIMFADNPDGKPISVIITTLAARAYEGESNVQDALQNILNNMGHLVSVHPPRVPNPVDPAEDFADRWATDKGRRLKLEENFWLWLDQVKQDFEIITSSDDINFISKQAKGKFGASLDTANLAGVIGVTAPSVSIQPKEHKIPEQAARPWMQINRNVER